MALLPSSSLPVRFVLTTYHPRPSTPEAHAHAAVKLVLLHDVKNDDGIRLFFGDVWELYTKVCGRLCKWKAQDSRHGVQYVDGSLLRCSSSRPARTSLSLSQCLLPPPS